MSEQQSAPSIVYVGHGTVLVDMDGVRVLTDPLLRRRVAHLRRAGKVDVTALRGVDAVLISHLHYDHLDFGSLARLGSEIPIVVPRGAGALVRRKGGRSGVIEIATDEEISIGRLRIRATHAEHDSQRLPFGIRADPIGYRIDGQRSVYFAGDTDVFPGMADLSPVDVALLPIWGWGPSLGAGHMDPRRAAQAAGLLGARLAIPIHWGTYYPIHLGLKGPPAFLETPPAVFEREIQAQAPATEVCVLRPGEETAF
jgi:L-ascorbate metabolism protein UlaG (beta-lactamase superfamily)